MFNSLLVWKVWMVLKLWFNKIWLIMLKRNKKNVTATAASSCGISFLFIDFASNFPTNICLSKLTALMLKQHSLELFCDVIKGNFNN